MQATKLPAVRNEADKQAKAEVTIVTGEAANQKIADRDFLKLWQKLAARCPWSTVFQRPEFVCVWYRVFAAEYAPVIVVSFNISGQLDGMLTLAWSGDRKELVVAGTHHAEYQAWLSESENSGAFMEEALEQLRDQFPEAASLRFLYLPPGTPLDWMQTSSWSKRHSTETHARPLMAIGDGSQFSESLNKKRYRARINRLNQMGTLCFERVAGPEELLLVFDDLTALCDFRHGAAHGTLPFRNNRLKRPLYEGLAASGVLEVTLLRAGAKIVSAQMNFRNGNELVLGTVMHSPFFGEFSPGTLHMYFIGMALAKERVSALDLTPGGAYKERFATHSDTVQIVTLYFSRNLNLRRKARSSLKTAAARICELAGVEPSQAKSWLGRLTRFPRGVKRSSSGLQRPQLGRCVLYSWNAEQIRRLPDSSGVHRNELGGLLCYSGLSGEADTKSFLGPALRRLESGRRVFTQLRNGCLQYEAWLAADGGQSLAPALKAHVPPQEALLYAINKYGPEDDEDSYSHFLAGAIRQSAVQVGQGNVWAIVPAECKSLKQAAEKLQASFHDEFDLSSEDRESAKGDA